MFKKSLFTGLVLIGTSTLADVVVSTTIYPRYSIVKEVGKEKVKLHNYNGIVKETLNEYKY